MRSTISPVAPASVRSAPPVGCGEERSSPRRRLVLAVTALARERGRRLTVARICKQAGIPVDAFYDAFSDAGECYSVTVEDTLEQLWAIIDGEVERSDGGWPERVAIAVATFLSAVDADRERAWLCLIEPLGDSLRAGRARTRFRQRFADLLTGDDDPVGGEPVSRAHAAGTVGSLWELAVQHVTGRGADVSLDEIAGSVTFLALTPRLGRLDAMQQVFTAPKPTEMTISWLADDEYDDE